MAKEHLIPFTKETAKEAGSKGGKASAKVRRRKRDMKQAMNMMLSLPISSANREALEKMGISSDDADNQMMMLAVVMKKALKGDMRAVEYITELTTINATMKAKIAVEKEKNKIMKEKLHFEMNQDENEDERKVTIINDLPK